MGNPLDEAKQARVNEIIQEVVGVFSKSFPIGYKNALISCIKVYVFICLLSTLFYFSFYRLKCSKRMKVHCCL